MIAKSTMHVYRLNLIRDLREREVKTERQHRLTLILGLGCFGFFFLSAIYSGITIWQMERVLNHENEKLQHLREEYKKYTATRLIVDKYDLELLNSLQGKGVFWTKKLAAMAKHLPENYWITSILYGNNELKVSGYGYPSQQQDQLLILDQYLNNLRLDSTFSDTFVRLQLTSADRKSDIGRVSFEFSGYTSTWKPQ
jgi:hypothetical protein